MKYVVAAAAAVLLAACAGGTRVASSTADTVTVRYMDGESGSADRAAADECSKYGKRSRLRNATSDQPGTGWRLNIYDCVQ